MLLQKVFIASVFSLGLPVMANAGTHSYCWSKDMHRVKGAWTQVAEDARALEIRLDALRDAADEINDQTATTQSENAEMLVKEAERASDAFYDELLCHGSKHLGELKHRYANLMESVAQLRSGSNVIIQQTLSPELTDVLTEVEALKASYGFATTR